MQGFGFRCRGKLEAARWFDELEDLGCARVAPPTRVCQTLRQREDHVVLEPGIICAFRVQGSGFRVQGSGFGVQGSGFRVWDLGKKTRVPADVELRRRLLAPVALNAPASGSDLRRHDHLTRGFRGLRDSQCTCFRV